MAQKKWICLTLVRDMQTRLYNHALPLDIFMIKIKMTGRGDGRKILFYD
jgi:hypothetical protein